MSRDIRSFFIKKDGGSSSSADNATSKIGSKKRNIKVIESDDDDDDDLIIDKPVHKKPKESNSTKKKTPDKKKEEKPKASPINVSSYFGTSPVQQKQQKINKTNKTPNREKCEPSSEKHTKSKKKKNKEKEKLHASHVNESFTIDNDDGFDETLRQIDDSELEVLAAKDYKKECEKTVSEPEESESGKIVAKKTPVKGDGKELKVKTPGSADSRGKNSLLDSEQKRRNAAAYQKFLTRGGPKNPGSKEIPKGTPTCLMGFTFVISGVLDSLEREEAVDLIQRCGGRVTGSVSRKTNYIVVGDEAGQAKLDKANKLGTKKLTEDELLNLIREKSLVDDESCSSQDFIEVTPKKHTSKYFQKESARKRSCEGDDDKSPDDSRKKVKKMLEVDVSKFGTNTKDKKLPNGGTSKNSEKFGSPASKGFAPAGLSKNEAGTGVDSLWVDKYKPKTTKQIIGQSGDKSNVKKLTYWLENWWRNNSNANVKKPRPAPWQSQDGSAFKAALLSGPPGVGKTTSVQLVCRELGLDIIEFNASDTRSKKMLKEEVSQLLSSKSIRGFLQENSQAKQVLVMDEVDGMAGNEDRGGVQELIQIIKHTKVPIICMCNDRSHQKMRSLVNYCYDLRYSKPRVEQIKGAMMSVCFKENLTIPSDALDEIIINANQDIRQVLHNLSVWSATEKKISTEQAQRDSSKAKKPMNLGPWDVARKVFSASDHSSMTLREKEELFFQDYNLGPLFVQDIYLRVKPHKAKNDKKATLDLLSKTCDSILQGDIIERAIRSQNAWSLLPVQAIFSSVLPGHYMEGHVQGQIQFPVWLGKNSKRNRFDRLLQELQSHMRLSITGSKEAVNLDYLQVLRDTISRPLLKKGSDGVAETLKIMSDYNLTKDDLDSIMELSLWPGGKDIFSMIDSKVKATLTRSYNKEGKSVPFATSVNVKKTKIENEYVMDGEDEEEEEENREMEDDVELDAMIKKGKPKMKSDRDESKGRGKKEKEAKKERHEKEPKKSKEKRK